MGFWRSNTGNLVYRLDAEETISDVSYHMLKNGALNSMLRVSRVSDDDRCELRYATDGYEIMGDFLRTHVFSKSQYARILLGVITAYGELDDCLMSADGMAASLDLMYITPKLDLGLVYLPIDEVKINFGLKDMLQKVDSAIEVTSAADLQDITAIRRVINEGSPEPTQLKRSLTDMLTKSPEAPVKKPEVTPAGGYISPQIQGQVVVPQPNPDAGGSEKDGGLLGKWFKPKPEKKKDEAVEIPEKTPEERPEKKPGLLGGLFKDKQKDSGGKPAKDKGKGKQPASFGDFAVPGMGPAAGGSVDVSFVPNQIPSNNAVRSQMSGDYAEDNFGKTMVAGLEPVAVKASGSTGGGGAALVRLDTNVRYEIYSLPFVVGRHKHYADLCITDHKQVSREHAAITSDGANFYIEDMGARNHTYVNGGELAAHQKVPIKSGDQIRFADCDFRFVIS